jgi:hypothetical protein
VEHIDLYYLHRVIHTRPSKRPLERWPTWSKRERCVSWVSLRCRPHFEARGHRPSHQCFTVRILRVESRSRS